MALPGLVANTETPLAKSRTCTLREATIFGSVIAKVSIPGNHSAAALLKLADMPYSGSTSLFIRIILNKKYALPRRVIHSIVNHFCSFDKETRQLPVLWHQALLTFAQRYKLELDFQQLKDLKELLRIQNHYQMTPEIRRGKLLLMYYHFAIFTQCRYYYYNLLIFTTLLNFIYIRITI